MLAERRPAPSAIRKKPLSGLMVNARANDLSLPGSDWRLVRLWFLLWWGEEGIFFSIMAEEDYPGFPLLLLQDLLTFLLKFDRKEMAHLPWQLKLSILPGLQARIFMALILPAKICGG